MSNDPCTAEQRRIIIRESIYRRGFLLWLAREVRKDPPNPLICHEASLALIQFAGEPGTPPALDSLENT